jgi:Mitochondrial mRNA-processing protein COX24, C-terminal
VAGARGERRYALAGDRTTPGDGPGVWHARFPFYQVTAEGGAVGSVIKKRRKRMAKKKHRKLLKKTRIQRRNKK